MRGRTEQKHLLKTKDLNVRNFFSKTHPKLKRSWESITILHFSVVCINVWILNGFFNYHLLWPLITKQIGQNIKQNMTYRPLVALTLGTVLGSCRKSNLGHFSLERLLTENYEFRNLKMSLPVSWSFQTDLKL